MPIAGRIVFTDQGYAITLPQGWLRLDYEDQLAMFNAQAQVVEPDLGSRCQALGQTIEECLATLAQEIQTSLQSSNIPNSQAAIDLHTVGNIVPTFVLLLTGGSVNGSIEDAVAGAKATAKAFAKGRVQSGFMQVPAGTAGYVSYVLSVANQELRIRQFLIIANGTLYSVATEGAVKDKTLTDNADALISSFEPLAP
jgi:hypothetical protein